jgi:hypothetical protein
VPGVRELGVQDAAKKPTIERKDAAGQEQEAEKQEAAQIHPTDIEDEDQTPRP